ncbi:MAG: hypothetical protein KDA80_16780 [Planctomycetaceae bacterium]|nr:hypothetical protein [Planctomycetaceae bacterium]
MDPFSLDLMSWLLRIAMLGVGASILYAIWRSTRPRPEIEISLQGGKILAMHGLPSRVSSQIEGLFSEDQHRSQRVAICGYRMPDRRLTFTFRGVSDRGVQQQIRNLILTHR